MVSSVSYDNYLIESLHDPIEAAGYLNAALEEGDIDAFLEALRNVIKAQGGITQLSNKTHRSRTSLYKTLSSKGNSYLKNTNEILHAMGLQLTVTSQSTLSQPKR